MSDEVTVSALHTPLGILGAARSIRGLLHITFPDGGVESAERWVHAHIPACHLRYAPAPDLEAAFSPFLSGQAREIDVPLDLRGTPFQQAVWNALLHIPYGQTRSYGDIAREIGRPTAVRAVGRANGANPLPIVVPCHRVIGARGTLTGYGGGLDLKRTLLTLEGWQA